MKESLSIVNEAIVIPGVVFKKNGVLMTKPVSVEQLNRMVQGVAELQEGVAWWWGDLGNALQGAKGAHYVSERSAIVGIDEGYWRNCVQMARFFELSCRHDTLSAKHHYEAMRGSRGDKEKADEWLCSAEKLEWSCSDLRKHINLSLATVHAPETPPEENEFEWLDDADHWAKSNMARQMDSGTARKMLSRMKDLLDFIEKVKAAAAS